MQNDPRYGNVVISIHALVKRATISIFCATNNQKISIHALVKRATIGNLNAPTDTTDFNPRPRKEGDHGKIFSICWIFYFNPRPRKEGDSFHCLYYNAPLYFNPRPRKEGDSSSGKDLSIIAVISIHALVKRAT